MNITRTFLLGIFPFMALIFFNIRIYQRFRRTKRRYTVKKNNNNSQQAKELQLARILILVAGMFFVTNLPRLLLNLYELFYINELMICKSNFVPSAWSICSTSVNHLLIVINCLMNFIIYCCYNKSFQNILIWRPWRRISRVQEQERNGPSNLQNGTKSIPFRNDNEVIEGHDGIPMQDLNTNQ